MFYLAEKNRIDANAVRRLVGALHDPRHVLSAVPLDVEIARQSASISREQVPDLPDRIIAATALRPGVPLITRDGRIRAASIQTVW
jgi:predicted nucleic acid-binding protein